MAYYNGPRRKKKVDTSIVRRRITEEEFQDSLNRAKDRPQPATSSSYRMIDGIPHKYADGKWIPLTKL